jgi:hypothetical protein
VLTLGSVTAGARTIHFDDFEDHRAARTGDGFVWGGNSRNVYTTVDPLTGARPTPLRGATALAFSHRAKPVGEDSSAQQMFRLGGAYPDLWLRYFVRIPENFTHRVDRGGANNKWLCVWSDRYSSGLTGLTICWNYLPSKTDPNGADIVFNYIHPRDERESSTRPFHSRMSDRQPLIARGMRGRWIEVVHHVQLPSRQGANNGAIQMWMRPVGRDNFVAIHDRRDLPLRWGTGPRGFTAGYLMGYANSGFSEATTFNIDDFQVMDSRPSTLRLP